MDAHSPPSSLASLLVYQPAQQEGAQTTSDEDGAALMTYLQSSGFEHSAQEAAAGSSNRYALNGSAAAAFRPLAPRQSDDGTVDADGVAVPDDTPGSPLDTSVAIPPALQALSLPPIDPHNLVPVASLPAVDQFTAPVMPLAGDRGEMGGKRRKQPQDRAGWKEMAEDDDRDKRRHDDVGASFVGFDASAAEAVATAVAAVEGAEVPDGAEGAEEGGDKPAKRAKLSKESRAEQNRKAQQVFRRKREEKIRSLEHDSLVLAGVKHRLEVAEKRLADLAMEYEAKTIEATGLRSAVTAIATGLGASVLRGDDNGLVLTESEFDGRKKDATSAADLGFALDGHARASRELAKVNRARRERTQQATAAAQAQVAAAQSAHQMQIDTDDQHDHQVATPAHDPQAQVQPVVPPQPQQPAVPATPAQA